MNKIIYLFLVVLVTISLPSCTKKFEELNTDPTQFINATPEALLAVSVKRTGDWVGAPGLNSGINVNMWEIANLEQRWADMRTVIKEFGKTFM